MGVENSPELKRPLQAILISPDIKQMEMILSGAKTVSIREGWRDYQKGPIVLVSHIEPWAVMGEIVEVKHKKLREVTEEECKLDGIGGPRELLSEMRRYYKKIDWNSAVTIVRWANLKGKLVPGSTD